MKKIYRACLGWPPSRRIARSFRAFLMRMVGLPEAFADLARLSRVADADLFLDIGCFEGDTILRFIDHGVRCKIGGFDPNAENISICRAKISHQPNAEGQLLALSNENGTRDFFVNESRQTSSLLDNDIGNLTSFKEATARKEIRTVESLTLDTWLSQNSARAERIIIKCDAQGAEQMIVQGAHNAFSNSVIAFYAELMLRPMYVGQPSFQELSEQLEKKYGLVLYNIYPCQHDADGKATQMDALWIKSNHLKTFYKLS